MGRNTHLYFVSGLWLLFCLAGLPATASSITVQNFSFENPSLPLIGYPGSWQYGGVTGWTTSPDSGVWYPNPVSTFFTAVPDGNQVAFSNGNSFNTGFRYSLYQNLTDTLTAGITYTLMVDVGYRIDLSPTPAYTVQLMTQGTNHVLAQENSLLPSSGIFQTSVVTYTVLNGDPYIGQALRINLISYATPGQNTQVDFDNVHMAATPIPSAAWLFGTGVVALVGLKRRRGKKS